MSEPGPGYFLDNYGECRLTPCKCLDPKRPRFPGGWVGRLCPDWVPLGAVSWAELLSRDKLRYKDTAQRNRQP